MSDIPEWLRELADESEYEEPLEGDLSADDGGAEPVVGGDSVDAVARASEPEVTPFEPQEEIRPQTSDQDDLALMEELRSQVDAEEDEEIEPASPSLSFSLDDVLIEGLEPVQQFVLAVLLFLDVVVIGLLFLVMLGRIAL
jgi:hypothetical protein